LWKDGSPPGDSTGVAVIAAHTPEGAAKKASSFKTQDEKGAQQEETEKQRESKQKGGGSAQSAAFGTISKRGVFVCPVEGCTRVFMYPKNGENHVARGIRDPSVHCASRSILRQGSAPAAQNTTVADHVKKQLADPSSSAVAGAAAMFVKQEDAVIALRDGAGEYYKIDGTTLEVPHKAKGWAAHGKRGGRRTYTEQQMGFIEWCYQRGCEHKGDKMNSCTAERLMAMVGTSAFNAQFPVQQTTQVGWKYPATPDSRPLFRAKDQLDHWTIKPWFSQQKAAFLGKVQAQVEAAQKGIAGYLGLQTLAFLSALCGRTQIDTTHPGEPKKRRLRHSLH
jgi:hypothetical protein